MKRLTYYLFVLALTATAVAQETAMFRANAAHTGVYNAAGVLAFTRVKWKFQTGGRVISSPAVVGGTVYVGSNDHNLYALDLEAGTLKWKFKTDSRVASSPAVSGGLVYFESYDGNFYAVDAAKGELKWKFATEGERRFAARHLHGALPVTETMPDPFDVFLSSPVVWNGAVYFGGGDSNIYALDAATGALKWKFKTGDVVHASPAIANGVLFIGSWDSYFYALDASTGAEKWRFKTGEDPDIHNQVGIQSSAAVADGMVYFGCRDSNLYALDAATGEKKWAFNNDGSWVIGSPAVREGKLYFATSDSSMFYELDARTGKQVFSLNFKKWPLFSSPAIAGAMAYVGMDQGKILAIDLTTHRLAWDFQTEASKQNGPALTKPDGSPNYRAAASDNFYDDLVTGFSKIMTLGSVSSSPVVVDKVIYVGSADGNIYALM